MGKFFKVAFFLVVASQISILFAKNIATSPAAENFHEKNGAPLEINSNDIFDQLGKDKFNITDDTIENFPDILDNYGIKNIAAVIRTMQKLAKFLVSIRNKNRPSGGNFKNDLLLKQDLMDDDDTFDSAQNSQLTSIFHGLRSLLESPESKPLLEAIHHFLPPLETASSKLKNSLAHVVNDLLKEVGPGAREFAQKLQTPEVQKVLKKLEISPEFHKLTEIFESSGVNLRKLSE